VSEKQESPANGLPSRNEYRSLRILRWGFAVTVLASIGAISIISLCLSNPSIMLAAQIAVIGGLGMVAEILIARADFAVHGERQKIRLLWNERHAELEEIATRDDLTQLQNRRFFYDHLQGEIDHAAEKKTPCSIMMLDVDDLKAVNDEFGHQVGDAVLSSFARVLNESVGDGHVTARLGGDEFAVIMPGADRREADELAWTIWRLLADTPVVETENASIFLGVSVGTSGFPWGGHDLEEIVHWADTKLYANKLERKGFKQTRDTENDSRLVSAVVDVLSTALDIRDRMTHRHAQRVARMAAFVAREMKLSAQDVLEVEYAAALHDIGKIGVADGILRKAAPLNDEEWREMRRHSELGYQILNGIDFLKDAAEIVYSHHEWYDGTGYPRGLVSKEIALGARIFAVVDAFDAMTSRRPYRDAMPKDAALMEIARHAGTQFDPQVVESFLVMVRRNPDGFRGEEAAYGGHVTTDAEAGHVNGDTPTHSTSDKLVRA